MRCPACGANLQIEDEKCPFCQNPNPFMVKHQRQMQYYHREFQETKQKVEKRVRHFNALTAKITVIAVLLVMITVMICIGDEMPFRIWSSQVRKDIAANVEDYGAKLCAYEKEGEWLSLYAFYDAKNLSYTSDFREYSVLSFMVYDYKSILDSISRYRTKPDRTRAAECALRIAQRLDSFYKSADRIGYESDYYDINYKQEHLEAYARIREDLEAELFAYCYLTEEELALLPDYSVSKKSSLIEEGLLRYENERKMAEK